MSATLYQWYYQTKKMIEKACKLEQAHAAERDLVQDWQSTVDILEDRCPGFKERYEKNKKMQGSFTPEQIDFICYQIGDWYLEWKDRMVIDLDKGQHRLGFAKEALKSLICGE